MTHINGLKKLATVATLALAASFAQASSVNLVVNGSFEAPVLPNTPSWQILDGIPGWTASNAGVEIRRQDTGLAQDGMQFAELDTTQNSWIKQVVDTVVGQEYTLSFWYSPRINRPNPEDNRIDAFVNGGLVASLAGTTGNLHNWQQTLFTFIADSTSTTLKFAAAGPSNSFGGSLDNVSLTATPLPGAALLFATALAGFFGFSNRRKV